MRKNKIGAFEISFAWLFSLIIGAAILFLAIYVATQIIGIGETQVSAKTGKEIGILLNPLETGFESARSASFTMPTETRIFGSCDLVGTFGRQLIRVSQKSFKKWVETDLEVQFLNKYIFNEEFVEGEKFYVFSKPFKFPFKVSDLIYLTSSDKEYCFIEAPEDIERGIKNINQGNFMTENCSLNSVKVCFEGGADCNIEVDYPGKLVRKTSGRMYFYDDALMYAAIFSDKEIYECQLKRLMKRVAQLSELYENKIALTSIKGCGSNLQGDLSYLKSLANGFEGSANFGFSITSTAEAIGEKNKFSSGCKLW